MSAIDAKALALRPETEADLAFLRELYASTRWEELAVTGWPPEQIEAFLRMQFEAQYRHYQLHYADASFDIILCRSEPAGRLYVHRGKKEVRIVDISLLPQWRGRGIGSFYLRQLIAEARDSALPVGIHVERNNPALGLYRRLGFATREDKGIYLYLVRPVDAAVTELDD